MSEPLVASGQSAVAQSICFDLNLLLAGLTHQAQHCATDSNFVTQFLPHCHNLIDSIRDGVEQLTNAKCGNAKIFVALEGDMVKIEGTSSIDVILAILSGDGKYKFKLNRETLVPLSEEAFLHFVHDTLAEDLQQGNVTETQLNLIENK
jgi:hypothetical protein